jgi:putative aldouronate transport system permease protein
MMVRKQHSSIWERLFDQFNYVFMTLFTLVCMYPFYYVFIYSISDPRTAARGIYFFPTKLSFDSYTNILALGTVPLAFVVSIVKTVLFTMLCVYFSSMFAYLLTKREMLFRKAVYRFVISSMYLSAGLIPWFITMKTYGLQDNFLLYIIPGAINAFYIILVKTYIEQIPDSLEESAQIDGAGFMALYNKIIFPLSKPIVATVAVYAAVGCWNTWMDNYFLVHKPGLQTIQIILFNYLNESKAIADNAARQTAGSGLEVQVSEETIKMAITMISVLPIMMVYPFLQKHFIKGIMLGAVKG